MARIMDTPKAALKGELKIAQTKGDRRVLLTTKEFVIEKVDLSYLIPLSEVEVILPYEEDPLNYYRIRTNKVQLFYESHVEERGKMDVIVSLHTSFLNSMPYLKKLKKRV